MVKRGTREQSVRCESTELYYVYRGAANATTCSATELIKREVKKEDSQAVLTPVELRDGKLMTRDKWSKPRL